MRRGTAQAIHHAAPPQRLRQAADRSAADAERAGRPGDRVRGRHGRHDAAGPRLRRGATATGGRVRRLATAVLKYWTCKRAPVHAAEALECLGGNGYVEEWPLAAPLPRGAAELDLGGLGQRPVPGRAAGVARSSRVARGPARRDRAPAGPTPGSTRTLDACGELASPTGRRSEAAGAAPGGAAGPGAPGLAPGPPRPGRGGGRLLRHPPGRGGRAVRDAAAGADFEAILERASPSGLS